MRRDTTQKLVKAVAGTIETYPPRLGVPTSCSARFSTPSTSLPTSLTSITPERLAATLTAAASQGDVDLTLSGGDPIADTATGESITSGPTRPTTDYMSVTLVDGTDYDIEATVAGNNGAGISVTGTITASVSVADGVITISDEADTVTAHTGTGDTSYLFSLSATGLVLSVRLSVLNAVPGTVPFSGVLVATPDDPSFVRGHSYVLDGTTTLLEVVCDQDSGAATTLHISEPLPEDVASGATLSGWRMAVSLSTADTANLGTGVVEWQATIGGVVEKWSTQFQIVERTGTYTLTATTLTSTSPYCREKVPDGDTDFVETIDAAWRRYLEPALIAKALKPERIVNGPHFEAAHIAACELHIAKQVEVDSQRRAEMKQDFTDALARVLAASDLWIVGDAEDLSGVGSTGTAGVQAWGVCFIDR